MHISINGGLDGQITGGDVHATDGTDVGNKAQSHCNNAVSGNGTTGNSGSQNLRLARCLSGDGDAADLDAATLSGHGLVRSKAHIGSCVQLVDHDHHAGSSCHCSGGNGEDAALGIGDKVMAYHQKGIGRTDGHVFPHVGPNLCQVDGRCDARIDGNAACCQCRHGDLAVGGAAVANPDGAGNVFDTAVAINGRYAAALEIGCANGHIHGHRPGGNAGIDGQHISKVHAAFHIQVGSLCNRASQDRIGLGSDHQNRSADTHAYKAAACGDGNQPDGRILLGGNAQGIHLVATSAVGNSVVPVRVGLYRLCLGSDPGLYFNVAPCAEGCAGIHQGIDIGAENGNRQANADPCPTAAYGDRTGNHVGVQVVTGQHPNVFRCCNKGVASNNGRSGIRKLGKFLNRVARSTCGSKGAVIECIGTGQIRFYIGAVSGVVEIPLGVAVGGRSFFIGNSGISAVTVFDVELSVTFHGGGICTFLAVVAVILGAKLLAVTLEGLAYLLAGVTAL